MEEVMKLERAESDGEDPNSSVDGTVIVDL